ncbi:MAG: UDP-N-acetylmuramoyl-L-alanine--D-glutamate ligase [Kiritimatiellaeota bacterium]|nr:UDP-N-acetylmuramoyl-L-alanine--D-glutamate ligase [Kiritimatiellota bacterium]
MGNYDHVNAVVLGAGLSGEWAARLLLSRGGRVTVLDERKDVFEFSGAVEYCRVPSTAIDCHRVVPHDTAFDVCVASPGFALDHPWIVACAERGVPVISELELGASYWRGKILAVTGSKGKSSLVKFCSDTLCLAGVAATPAGNYGVPMCQLVMEKPDVQWAVVEVSSFQMEHSPSFHPHIAILLNLQPDHLDRHGSFEEYRRLKFALFANMGADDFALLPQGLDAEGMLPEGVPREMFSSAVGCHRMQAGAVGFEAQGVSLAGTWFDNEVLAPAAAAGGAALRRIGLTPEQIQKGLEAFAPLPHRMQEIGTDARGVTWVDDSKATSLSALAAALKMARKPVRLIAGGVLKEKDLKFLTNLLAETTRKVYIMGQCAGQMVDAWASAVPCEIYGTIERAVSAAAQDAQRDEIVLLSPGTASFDQFSGYRERGERFTELVRAVAGL